MNIKVVVVGYLDTNCYILEKGNSVLIIDPGADSDVIKSEIDPFKEVVGVIVTHSHDDHIGALDDILKTYKCNLYNMKNMSEGNHVLNDFSFKVIYTPGHLDDSISIYFEDEKVMFVGDFIFYGSIGRTDMLGANPSDMKKSIKKILEYPLDTTLFPGHYESTILGNEVLTLNYFMNII